MLKSERLDCCPEIIGTPIKYLSMGNVVKTQYMSNRNRKQTIQLLPFGHYMELSTGEIRELKHGTSREDNKNGLYKTFNRLKNLLNANITNTENVKWITLTYAENMQDTKRLYADFEKFHKKVKRYLSNKGIDIPSYIVVMEPQKRGAWHCHLLYIWKHKAPYINNNDIAEMWGQGFTKSKRLKTDDIGAYLTAYLTDIPLDEFMDDTRLINANMDEFGNLTAGTCKEVTIQDDNSRKKKQVLKGGRLALYPSNFRLYRHSRDIIEPIEEYLAPDVVHERVNNLKKTYEKHIRLYDEESFETIISTCYYNRAR